MEISTKSFNHPFLLIIKTALACCNFFALDSSFQHKKVDKEFQMVVEKRTRLPQFPFFVTSFGLYFRKRNSLNGMNVETDVERRK